jgi:hypothetical protein
MSNERPIKTFERPDGKQRLSIMARDDGLYRFVESSEFYAGVVDVLYWAPTYWSGIYETAEAAERDARLIIPWLRDQPSN